MPGIVPTEEALRELVGDDVPIVPVSSGEPVLVKVTVANSDLMYTVSLDSRVLIKNITSRQETIDGLTAGVHRLAWAFTHRREDWRHEVSVTPDDGDEVVLESLSAANGDNDVSVGLALLLVS